MHIKKITALLMSALMLTPMISLPASAEEIISDKNAAYDNGYGLYDSLEKHIEFDDVFDAEEAEETVTDENTADQPTETQAAEKTVPEPAQAAAKEEVSRDTFGDFEYYVKDRDIDVVVTKYNGSAANVVIPDTINGDTVTDIGSYAFEDCTDVQTVKFPKDLETIGYGAFSGCENLKSLDLPGTLTTIGEYAFSGCTKLTSLDLPDTVKTIEDYAFSGCTKLASFHYPANWQSGAWGVFENCESLTTITVPEGITEIADNAFGGANYLKTVVLPSTLEKIGNSAFLGCAAMTEINLPASLKTLGDSAFDDCTSLQKINFPAGLTTIGSWAFDDCVRLKSADLPDSVTTIGRYAFQNCKSLESFTYPKSFEDVTDADGDYAWEGFIFKNCEKLTTVTVPEGVTEIPRRAFEGANYLKTVVLPSTLETIGDCAFLGCEAMTEVALPASLKTLGDSAFDDCTSLQKINFPAGLTTIGSWAFDDCVRLKSADLPDSVTTIGRYAFQNCKSLESFTYPKSFEDVTDADGDYAWEGFIFKNCEKLTTVTVPEGVTEIPRRAFEGANYLKTVVLPSTLETIGDCAFLGCEAMTEVALPASLKTLGDSAFDDCTSLQKVDFNDGLTTIGSWAFDDCMRLKSADLPDSVTTIGRYAFQNCKSLESFTYPKNFEGVKDANGYFAYEGGIFKDCEKLTTITVPEGITEIPKYAFEGANYLQTVVLPTTLESIGYSAFDDSGVTTVYCPKYTQGAISLIDNKINLISNNSERKEQPRVLDLADCRYYLTSGSKIHATCAYSIKPEYFVNGSDFSVKLYIPDGAQVNEGSLYLDKELCTDFYADDNSLTIPVNSEKGIINYDLSVDADCVLNTYAVLNYRLDDGYGCDIIDVLNDEFEIITLNADEVVSSEKVNVSGIAPASTDVKIYVDGKLAATVKSNKAGMYTAEVNIGASENDAEHTIKTETTGKDGEKVSANSVVKYQSDAPELTSFKMDYNGSTYDVLRNKRYNVTFNPSYEFKFRVKYSHTEKIDAVFVTSTKNQVTKRMKAVYDEKTDTYTAKGFFDDSDHSYVPGTIGVEYVPKTADAVYPLENIEEEYSEELIPDILKKAKHELVEDTENRKQIVITLEDGEKITYTFEKLYAEEFKKDYEATHKKSGVQPSGAQLAAAASNDVFDILKDVVSYAWDVYDNGIIQRYCDADTDDESTDIFWSYENTHNYVVKESVSYTKKQATKFALAHIDSEPFSAAYKVGTYVYKANQEFVNYCGTVIDYNLAKAEIMASSLPQAEKDAKIAQLTKARDAAFEVACLKIIGSYLKLTGGYMMAEFPPLGFAIWAAGFIMNDIMASHPDLFKELARKFTSFKNRLFVFQIDPSGFIYEGVMSNRVQDAKVTAYWIPYNEEDTEYWDSPKEENAVIWNSEEYGLDNPLITDADGNYAWDVPEGWWKVVVEKDGYETNESEWLPVPPPQTNVNISLTSTAAPAVESAEVSENKIIVTFTQYMDPATAAGITVTDKSGTNLNAKLTYSTDEHNKDNTVYARTYTLELEQPIETVVVNVPADVTSYNGKKVSEFTKELKMEVNNDADHTPGDINGDGKVNMKDLTRLHQYINGWNVTVVESALDVNGDKKVNMKDLTRLHQYINGWDVKIA